MIPDQARRLQRIRKTALLLTALALLVVLLSAYLRLEGAGLGCVDWPECYAQLLDGEPPPQQFGAPRLLHRAAASASLLLACCLAWLCLRRPSLPSAARPACALLLLMLALAVLGLWSADPRLALVNFLNIVGGLGLVTFSWRVVLASRPQTALPASPAPTLLLRLGCAALSLSVLLGALIGARYAALACPSLPDCAGHWWPEPGGWVALRPFAPLLAAPPAGEPAGMTLHLLHRWSALCTLLVLAGAALQLLADDGRRRAAVTLLALLLMQVTLGIVTVFSGFKLWLAIGHGVGAAALLATLATLLRRQCDD